MTTPTPGRTVWLIARREIDARLRTRSFVLGTAVATVVLVGLVLTQGALVDPPDRSRVGLAGQATAIAVPLVEQTRAGGTEVTVTTVAEVPAGEAMVAAGELDVLVSGAPSALRVVVRDALDEDLREVLNNLVQEQVLRAQLAAVEDLDADEVLTTVAGATIDVHALGRPDPRHDQRLAVALAVVALLYLALLVHGAMVAHGMVEEKSCGVEEVLLAVVRPWQLLLGKVLGLGLLGLGQFTAVGAVGLVLALLTDVLTVASAAGILLWSVLWYLLGYLFHAAVFAVAGSPVSRQEETQAALLPVTAVLVAAFVLGFGLLSQAPTSTAAEVLSMLPPLAPIMMPGRIALAAAPGWQIALAVVLLLASVAALAWLGSRVRTRSASRSGPRLRLGGALRD